MCLRFSKNLELLLKEVGDNSVESLREAGINSNKIGFANIKEQVALPPVSALLS